MAARKAEIQPLSPWFTRAKTADGVFAVDTEQRITFWSPTAQQLMGYEASEVLGLPCQEVIGGRDARNHRFCRRKCPIIESARRGRSTPNYDVRVQTKEGGEAWVNMSTLVVGNKSEGPPSVVHLFRDVTQRRGLEERAEKAMAALKQYLAEDGTGEGDSQEPSPTTQPQLTRREQEVLRLLAAGLNTGQMAGSLGVSPITARNHITSLLTKLGVENRLQAVLYASHHRLV